MYFHTSGERNGLWQIAGGREGGERPSVRFPSATEIFVGQVEKLAFSAKARVLPISVAPGGGVTVSAVSPNAPGTHTAVTDHAGFYRLLDLPPADYSLNAELQGFS